MMDYSNHPKSILNQLPCMIEHRISSLSSSEEIFQEVVEQYNIALKKAGYEKNLHYKAEASTTETQNAKKKKR